MNPTVQALQNRLLFAGYTIDRFEGMYRYRREDGTEAGGFPTESDAVEGAMHHWFSNSAYQPA